MERADTVVVGGGIAGLASAWQLALRGSRVVLLEREPTCAAHSSGRNAAIFRQLDRSPHVVELARRSRTLLDALLGPGWLKRTGSLYVAARRDSLLEWERFARDRGLGARWVEGAELLRMAPALEGGAADSALLVPDDGVIDIHAVTSGIERAARGAGAELRTGCEVSAVATDGAVVRGVVLASGERVEAERVVLAPGAWASSLGAACGAALPLRPLRRHLVLLDAPVPKGSAVVWRVDSDETYFRAESGGALCSPCDEDAFEPCLPPESKEALEALAVRMAMLAPVLARAGVRKSWACLRTFAPDRALVAGEDPRVRGLFWLAGLGGHGMTAGAGAGELVARAILGDPRDMADDIAATRLLARPIEIG